MEQKSIIVHGARVNNLKNVSVEIPRNKLVIITGLSGCGKTSLAFDTLYAEGQRRYVESLSSYARQFLGQMDKPDVDLIEGLSPAISIDQKSASRNPRSTVGTVTEIHDYLRLLYANIGIPHCPHCGAPIERQNVDNICDRVMALPEGTRLMLLAPVVRNKKGEHVKILSDLAAQFVRARIDGEMRELSEDVKLSKTFRHTIEVVVDRLVVRPGLESRLTDSLETALRLGGGIVTVSVVGGEEKTYSENYACVNCDVNIPELSPRLFTFNNPLGACPTCTGLGVRYKIDPALVVPDPSKSLSEGAVRGSGWKLDDPESMASAYFRALSEAYGFRLDVPFRSLPEEAQQAVLYGTGERRIEVRVDNSRGSRRMNVPFEGVIPNLQRRYEQTTSFMVKWELEQLMMLVPCPDCRGRRFRPEVLGVTVGGLNIAEFSELPIQQALAFIDGLEPSLSERDRAVTAQIFKEIRARLQFLVNVGLDYLTLARGASTLSGGEAQRIRLATQIGSGLTGVMYVLDEPSIGLHQRDNARLIEALKKLRDAGNSLIVVEHDDETMLSSDYIVDMGPGAGIHGGSIVAVGTPAQIMACPDSVTGQYLSGRLTIPVPAHRRSPSGWLTVFGARVNNLKNIDVSFPAGVMTSVTGVSGSGKSSLVNEILAKALQRDLMGTRVAPGDHDRIEGVGQFDKVILINQQPIGRTPRSNPATYTGLFNDIRTLFAGTNDARERGYGPGRFSFNVKGGRCEACSGDGILKIEMHFLPDVYVPCDVCHGSRYNRETLSVRYKGKNIAEVLDMTAEEALAFFGAHSKLTARLQTLCDVGLGYIKLGQPSTTLSGGEAQRIKLATELCRRSTGKTVYILDEPTTGLHDDDVKRLIAVLDRLVASGNTVLVIEHNLDVIKVSDYIVDLGPEGGDRGGTVVAEGTPEQVAAVPASYTGQYLRHVLVGKRF